MLKDIAALLQELIESKREKTETVPAIGNLPGIATGSGIGELYESLARASAL